MVSGREFLVESLQERGLVNESEAPERVKASKIVCEQDANLLSIGELRRI